MPIRNPFYRSALPKTGQTTVYQVGDDGSYEKGYGLLPRFVDNGDGTITDMATGLMWVKDGNGAGCNYGAGIAWAAAIDFCEALDFAGYDDWRLPNIKELVSILDYGRYGPAIDPIFINTRSGSYWQSTTYLDGPDTAYVLDFEDGLCTRALKTATVAIRPVRGGR